MRAAITFGFLSLISPAIAGASDTVAATCGVDVSVRFVEGAPVDRFIIANGSTQNYAMTQVAFDLSASKGRLIFDTANGGAGVEVFQPFASSIANVEVREMVPPACVCQ